MALVTGTSTQFVKPSAATFTAAPQWAGTPSGANDLANKSYVDAQVAAGLPNFGTAGTYTKVTTDAKGRISSGTTLAASDIPALDAAKITTGVLPIANGGTNSSTALVGSKVMVSNATAIVEGMASNTAKSNNTFVMRDGTGSFAAALGTFDGLSVLAGGGLALNGATSGSISMQAPTSPTSYTLTLPPTAGTIGQVLTTDGSGITSWASAGSGLPAAAGTTAAPGYAFSGNTNTGMFGAATNQIGFSTNGVERLRVDASGNVGIGNSSPSFKLDVAGVARFSNIEIGSGGDQINNSNGTMFFNFSNTQNISMVQGGGRVGIGTTNPLAPLHVKNTASSTASIFEVRCAGCGAWLNVFNSDASVGANNQSGIRFSSIGSTNYYGQIAGIQTTGSSSYGALAFSTATAGSTTEKMRIDENGNVGIGTTSPGAQLQTNTGATGTIGQIIKWGQAGQTGNLLEFQNDTGTILSRVDKDGKFYGDGSGLTGISGALSGLTAGKIPKAGSATTVVDSSLTENATDITSTKKIIVPGDTVGVATTAETALIFQSNAGAGAAMNLGWNGGVGINTATNNSFEVLGIASNTSFRINSGNFVAWDFSSNFAVDNNLYLSQTNGAAGSLIMNRPLVNNTNSASTALNVTQSGAGSAATFMGGNVGIGVTGPTSKLQVAGDITPDTTATKNLGSSSLRWNNIYLSNAPDVSSDARLKKDVKTSDLGLDFINSLRPVSWNWKDQSQGTTQHYGVCLVIQIITFVFSLLVWGHCNRVANCSGSEFSCQCLLEFEAVSDLTNNSF